MSATLTSDCSGCNGGALYLSLELGWNKWVLGFTSGLGDKLWKRTIAARDLLKFHELIGRAKQRLGLAADAPVRSCYEAGRDGFWLHRHLEGQGIVNLVVDSASIEVNRRQRRSKTDALDVAKLGTMLCRWWLGEKQVWSVVRVPTLAQEDQRQLHRELGMLKGEQTRHVNRVRAYLACQGIALPSVTAGLPKLLPTLHLPDGRLLSEACPQLCQRVLREHDRLERVREQIAELEKQRDRVIREGKAPAAAPARKLMRLRGIGAASAYALAQELEGRGSFTRRQLGGLAGLCPSKYQSGDSDHDRGISKAGNRRLRTLMVELGWSWVRFQGGSVLTQWFVRRFAGGGKRLRKIGIVGLARKLLIALWRYLSSGQEPPGAVAGDWRAKFSHKARPAAAGAVAAG
jgi:transposase